MRRTAMPLVSVLCAAFIASRATAGEEGIRLKDGAGRDVTASHCVICHSLDYIPMNAPVMNHAAWEKTIRKMIGVFGAPITDEDESRILDYLSEHYSS